MGKKILGVSCTLMNKCKLPQVTQCLPPLMSINNKLILMDGERQYGSYGLQIGQPRKN